MARTRHMLALCTLLSGAPLFAAGIAAAQPASAPERAVPADTQQLNRAAPDTAPGTTPVTPRPAGSSDMAAPTTPMPMNLPDHATQSEVQGQYGIGIAGLILGTLFIAALVLGGVYFISRRSWSAQHH